MRGIAAEYLVYPLALAASSWLGSATLARLVDGDARPGSGAVCAAHAPVGRAGEPVLRLLHVRDAVRRHPMARPGRARDGAVALTLYVLVSAAGSGLRHRHAGRSTLRDTLRALATLPHSLPISAPTTGDSNVSSEACPLAAATLGRRRGGAAAILAHAAETLGAQHVVLVWEEHDEPSASSGAAGRTLSPALGEAPDASAGW